MCVKYYVLDVLGLWVYFWIIDMMLSLGSGYGKVRYSKIW